MKKIFLCCLIVLSFGVVNTPAQNKLTLEECKQFALQNNYSGKNSRLETEASRQVKKSVFTKFFPDISAGGVVLQANENLVEIETKGGKLPVYDGNPANIKNATQFAYMPGSTMGLLKKGTFGFVNAIQPVFAGGRIYNGYQLAQLGEEVSTLKEKMETDEIMLKTEEQYWLLISLEEKNKTILKYEEYLNRLLQQAEDAYSSGLIMKNDVLKVRLKLSEVLLKKSKLDNGRKLAAMAFCQYIGINYDSTLAFSEKPGIPAIPESYFIDKGQALRVRTEYNLLEKSVEAEELQTKLKIGEYLPQAAVGVSGVYMKFDESEKRTLGMIFGTVQVPISGWWGGSHELQERNIKEEIAENNFRNNSELLLLQIEKSWQDLKDSYKQYLLSEESLIQAEENMKLNDDSYINGLTDISDLLEAKALLQEAQDSHTESVADYMVKKAEYLQATGQQN